MSDLYPLKFKTIFKEKLWGGRKVKTVLGKDFGDLDNCGETWEISGVKGDVSEVANGPLKGKGLDEVVSTYTSELLGESVYDKFGAEFPLLVKFIDANQDLSIQVHPDDELARERHNCHGKSEMWYVFQADEGSSLISGFNKTVTKNEYLEKFEKGELLDILNQETVEAGDVFYLPAGRVHTIGKGLLLAEIQETSDITYRIYDFDRVDKEGNRRELHTEQALEALDFEKKEEYKTIYRDVDNQPVELIDCQYFTSSKIKADEVLQMDYEELDSFVIYVCFEGALEVVCNNSTTSLIKGEALLLPASIDYVELIPQESYQILESYIEIDVPESK